MSAPAVSLHHNSHGGVVRSDRRCCSRDIPKLHLAPICQIEASASAVHIDVVAEGVSLFQHAPMPVHNAMSYSHSHITRAFLAHQHEVSPGERLGMYLEGSMDLHAG